MNSTFIRPEMQEVLRGVRDDEEVAASISFVNENAAQRFANLANQVVLDTTLNVDFGEGEITERLRNCLSPKIEDLNIQAIGDQVATAFPRGVLEAIDRTGDSLGVLEITQIPLNDRSSPESWGEDWVTSSDQI